MGPHKSPRGLGAQPRLVNDDGLHLNDKGNRIWAAAIKAVLMVEEAQHETTND